jgi:hypothetical protein
VMRSFSSVNACFRYHRSIGKLQSATDKPKRPNVKNAAVDPRTRRTPALLLAEGRSQRPWGGRLHPCSAWGHQGADARSQPVTILVTKRALTHGKRRVLSKQSCPRMPACTVVRRSGVWPARYRNRADERLLRRIPQRLAARSFQATTCDSLLIARAASRQDPPANEISSSLSPAVKRRDQKIF